MEQLIWDQLQTLLESLLLTLLLATIPVAGAYLRQWLRQQLGQKQLDSVLRLARTAVLAAEQEGFDLDGQQKKDLAVNTLQVMLHDAGVEIDAGRLATIVESVVYDELNRWQPLEQPALEVAPEAKT